MAAVNCFTNPFTVDSSRLVKLASGATAAQSVEDDVLNAEKTRRDQKEKFIQERLQTHEKNFFDPIKQNKLKTMSQSSKKSQTEISKQQTDRVETSGKHCIPVVDKVK